MLLTSLLVPLSLAAPTPLELPPIHAQSTDASRAGGRGPSMARDFLQEVNVRARYLALPESILDIWYFDGNTETDAGLHPERPKVRAMALGLEYVLKREDANGIFYFEYMPALMESGYWDDRQGDDEPNYDDGDYVVANGLALYILGANYGYELKANPWLSFVFGGGLGLAIRSGELEKWDTAISTDETNNEYLTATQNYEANPDDPDEVYQIPRVLPVLDITAAVRFTISDVANIRLEGGLHDLLYFGAAAGIVF